MTIGKLMKKCGDWPYMAFRVVVGLLFMLHGAQKYGLFGDGTTIAKFAGLFHLPLALAYAAATIELVGGACILLGLFTRTAAFLGSINMIVALATVHFPNGINPLANQGELSLLFLASFLVIMVNGARAWSLEKAILRHDKF